MVAPYAHELVHDGGAQFRGLGRVLVQVDDDVRVQGHDLLVAEAVKQAVEVGEELHEQCLDAEEVGEVVEAACLCAQRDGFLPAAATFVLELAEGAAVHPGDNVLEAGWVFVLELDGVGLAFDEVAVEGAAEIGRKVTEEGFVDYKLLSLGAHKHGRRGALDESVRDSQ